MLGEYPELPPDVIEQLHHHPPPSIWLWDAEGQRFYLNVVTGGNF